MRYAFYPGCATEQIGKELYNSTKKVCSALGIELMEYPSFNCCGASVIRERSPDTELVLNARNFAIAQKSNLDIMTVCSTCLITMNRTRHTLDRSEERRDYVNQILSKSGLTYQPEIKIKHLLWVLQDYGLDKIRNHVIKPLRGIKIAPFYGCHTLRPSKYFDNVHYDRPDSPQLFERFVRLCGAESVTYRGRLKCCGFHTSLLDRKISGKMMCEWTKSADESGADMMVVLCPFCHAMMDTNQSGTRLPVLHASQLLGLAMGMSYKELGLGRHVVSSKKLLKKFDMYRKK